MLPLTQYDSKLQHDIVDTVSFEINLLYKQVPILQNEQRYGLLCNEKHDLMPISFLIKMISNFGTNKK